MKITTLIPLGLLLGGFAVSGFSCTDAQTQEAQAIVAVACAGATAGSAVISTDGQIVGTTANQQKAIAEGQQLVTVNCAAAQAGIAAVAAAMKVNAATALVEEVKQANKLHLPMSTVRALIQSYDKGAIKHS